MNGSKMKKAIEEVKRSTCSLTYRCPASGAEISEWKDIGRG